MEERGVRTRVNTSQAYIWEDAVQYATYPTASAYSDSQVGDLVEINSAGQLVRSPSGGSGVSVSRYRGVVVGIAPDSGEYPAFGDPFNRPLVAILAPNKTELIVRQIDNDGNYIAPTLPVNASTKFVYNASTRRWGVQPLGSGETATGRVIKVLSDGRLLIILSLIHI